MMIAQLASWGATALNLGACAYHVCQLRKLNLLRKAINGAQHRLGVHISRLHPGAMAFLVPGEEGIVRLETIVNEEIVDRMVWLRDQHMTGDRLTDEIDETLFQVSRPAKGDA